MAGNWVVPDYARNQNPVVWRISNCSVGLLAWLLKIVICKDTRSPKNCSTEVMKYLTDYCHLPFNLLFAAVDNTFVTVALVSISCHVIGVCTPFASWL
jgi:hypothetical protein